MSTSVPKAFQIISFGKDEVSSSDEVSVCMSNMLTLTVIELHVADCPYLQRPRTATCSKDAAYDEM